MTGKEGGVTGVDYFSRAHDIQEPTRSTHLMIDSELFMAHMGCHLHPDRTLQLGQKRGQLATPKRLSRASTDVAGC